MTGREEEAQEATTRTPPGPALERIEPRPPTGERGPWPRAIGDAARIGLPGEVLGAIEPGTEGDPNAILIQFLAATGSLLGGGPHVVIDEKRHPLKVWVIVVGRTADGKKGTGANRVVSLLDEVDPSWALRRKNGIASGEAIVHQVRDDRVRVRRVRDEEGAVSERRVTIEGVRDKRLLLREEEFSRVLRVSRMAGSTLSATVREAWDSDVLMTTAKTAPERATGAHIIIVGHITPEELRREMRTVELASGFANRFLFACSRRSKRLARPPRMPDGVRRALVERLRGVVRFVGERAGDEEEARAEGRSVGLDSAAGVARADDDGDGMGTGAATSAESDPPPPDPEATTPPPPRGPEITLSEAAWDLWAPMKREVEDEIERADAAGLALARVITRGPPTILRLAAIYAVLEETLTISPAHLRAAREVWRYSVDSARVIFGDEVAHPDARRILEALADREGGRLRRCEVSDVLGRHRSAREVDRLRDVLILSGRIEAYRETGASSGRPAEWWVRG